MTLRRRLMLDVRPGRGRDGRAGVARLLPGHAQRAARAGRPPAARAGRARAAHRRPARRRAARAVAARRRAGRVLAGRRARRRRARSPGRAGDRGGQRRSGRGRGRAGAPFLTDRTADGVHLRVITVPIEGLGAVQLGRSLESVDAVLGRLRIVLVLLVLVGTAFAALLARLFARPVIRPISELTRTAEHIEATGDLGRRIGARGEDEVGRMAQRFDAMLDRVQASQARPAPARGRRLARAAHAGDLAADQHGGHARGRRARGGRAARAAARHGGPVRGAQRARGRPHRAGARRRGRPADRGRGPRRARGRGGGAGAAPRAGRPLPDRARAVRDRRRARPARPRGQQRPRQRGRVQPARRRGRGRAARRRARGPRPRSGGAGGGAGAALRPLLPRHAAAGAGGLGPRAGHRAPGRRGRTERPSRPPTPRAAGWSSGSPSRRPPRPRAERVFGLPNFARGRGARFGKTVGRTGSPIPSRLGATNERHIQHLRRSRRPQRASAGLAAAPAVADARPLHARAPGRARAALPAGGGGPRRLRDRTHERRARCSRGRSWATACGR